jgi:hypothetical protein
MTKTVKITSRGDEALNRAEAGGDLFVQTFRGWLRLGEKEKAAAISRGRRMDETGKLIYGSS